jgi:hypothetical protein
MRKVLGTTGLGLLALTLVVGCSNGVQEGMPTDASVAKAPEGLSHDMAAFAKSNKGARGNGSRSQAPPLGALPSRR